MTTTPKGYTELTNADAMSGPEQINVAERHVEDLIDPTVPTPADLPASGNWNGRQIRVDTTKRVHVHDGTRWNPKRSMAGFAVGSAALAGMATGASVTVPIVFPAGEFTIPPILTAMTGNSRLTTSFANKTVNGADLIVSNWSGGTSIATTINWFAVQASLDSAAS